jgi:hypothetical protein
LTSAGGPARALLTNPGAVRRLTGHYHGAAQDQQQALGITREIGNRDAELTALNESGTLSRTRDDLGRACSCHQQALDLAREIGGAPQEAHALAALGPVRPGRRRLA